MTGGRGKHGLRAISLALGEFEEVKAAVSVSGQSGCQSSVCRGCAEGAGDQGGVPPEEANLAASGYIPEGSAGIVAAAEHKGAGRVGMALALPLITYARPKAADLCREHRGVVRILFGCAHDSWNETIRNG